MARRREPPTGARTPAIPPSSWLPAAHRDTILKRAPRTIRVLQLARCGVSVSSNSPVSCRWAKTSVPFPGASRQDTRLTLCGKRTQQHESAANSNHVVPCHGMFNWLQCPFRQTGRPSGKPRRTLNTQVQDANTRPACKTFQRLRKTPSRLSRRSTHFSCLTTTVSFCLRTTAVSHRQIVPHSRRMAAKPHRTSSVTLQSVTSVHGQAWNGISTHLPIDCQNTRFQLLVIPAAIYGC